QRLDLTTGAPTFDPSGLAFHTGHLPGAPIAYVVPTAGGDCLATALDPSDGVVMYRMASNGATAWTRKLDEDGPADRGPGRPHGQGGAFATWYDPLDGAMVQRRDGA